MVAVETNACAIHFAHKNPTKDGLHSFETKWLVARVLCPIIYYPVTHGYYGWSSDQGQTLVHFGEHLKVTVTCGTTKNKVLSQQHHLTTVLLI